MPISRSAASIAATASLSEACGARLKLMVTAGNCSWCAITSGAVVCSKRANADERHLRAAGAGHVEPRQRIGGSLWYCGIASRITRYWLDCA